MKKNNMFKTGAAILSSAVCLNLLFATASFAAVDVPAPNYNPNSLPSHPVQASAPSKVTGTDEFHYFTFPAGTVVGDSAVKVQGTDEFHYFTFPAGTVVGDDATKVQGTDDFKFNSFPAHKVDPAQEQVKPAANQTGVIFG